MAPPQSSQAVTCGLRPAGELPYCALFDFLFSNPFAPLSPIIVNSPSPLTRAHHIPIVPHSKPIFIDGSQGKQLSWLDAKRSALAVGYSFTHRLSLRPPPLPAHLPGFSSYPLPSVVSPVVLIQLPNGIPLVTLLLGALAAGLTVTMLNPALTAHELHWVLQSAKPAVVVTSKAGADTMLDAIAALDDPSLRAQLVRHIYVVDDGQEATNGPASSAQTVSRACAGEQVELTDWTTLLDASPEAAFYKPFRFVEPEREARSRIAVILWSSGTSGKSKGVMSSHFANVNSVVSFWHHKPEYGPNERLAGFVPFYHVLGLQNVLMFAITAGSMVYLMGKFEQKKFLEMVTEHKITFLQMAPPVAVFLAKSPLLDNGLYDLSSVKGSMSGGAPLPDEIIKAVYQRCGFLIKAGYGLSESGNVANQLGSTLAELVPQFGTVGEAMYGVELRIVAVGSTEVVATDEEGEIQIRSPSIMNAYLNNEAETQRTLGCDGWMSTGDLGRIDRHGRLSITDRLKDVIKVKGFQVSPSDLEGVVCTIAAVGEVAVTSIYSRVQATELPRAYIVPRDTRLANFCGCACRDSGVLEGAEDGMFEELVSIAGQVKRLVERQLTHYKWLRGNIIFSKQIPKSSSGKILKRLLKDTQGIEVRLYGDDCLGLGLGGNGEPGFRTKL